MGHLYLKGFVAICYCFVILVFGELYNVICCLFDVCSQLAKKVMPDSPGLVDFVIWLVIFVLNLLNRQVFFFWKFKLQKDCNQSCESKRVLGLVEMTCGLVHASYSLPEWQAVKLTIFATL